MGEISHLDEKQLEAVQYTDGALLILAGAGSGKTTVIVNRIANIIKKRLASADEILAITFTNKAAEEVKERIHSSLGEKSHGIWASTFHAMCMRILRRYIDRIGFDKNFNIFDRNDQISTLKDILKENSLDDKIFAPKSVLSVISRAKDNLKDAERFAEEQSNDYRGTTLAKIYSSYEKKLKTANALDFDDIIVKTVELLRKNEDVLLNYSRKFKYVMVDEYQDTNYAQYKLVSLLASFHGNICVVGDDDQSIYKFRGANIENILNFEDFYTDARIIKLEQNYRSTQNILNAANSVIKNNRGRKSKKLWTLNDSGEKITLHNAENEYAEGQFIASQICSYKNKNNLSYSDFAVLYRTNAQSRVIEEMLLKSSVPYRVLGGTRFYDRKEIKDIVSYLRLINNFDDNLSLKRIINEPKRGIGKTTLETAESIASETGCSVFSVLRSVYEFPGFSRSSDKLHGFAEMIISLRELVNELSLKDFVSSVLSRTGYIDWLKKEKSHENISRIENLSEFLSIVQEYENQGNLGGLSGLLESIALYSDIDDYDDAQDSVSLMTLHSAKGLEFPVVFMSGMEDGIFPGHLSISDKSELEEERRLCYVGITRAKEKLFFTHTKMRTLFGSTSYNKISRFVTEIPRSLLIDDENSFSRVRTDVHSITACIDDISCNLAVGQKVKHKKFGQGLILNLQNVGSDIRVEVIFDDVGTKNLMAAYANLEVI